MPIPINEMPMMDSPTINDALFVSENSEIIASDLNYAY